MPRTPFFEREGSAHASVLRSLSQTVDVFFKVRPGIGLADDGLTLPSRCEIHQEPSDADADLRERGVFLFFCDRVSSGACRAVARAPDTAGLRP
jgi:hypothetical protein